MSSPSQFSLLTLLAGATGTIPLGFGINAMLRPEHALSFFAPLVYPTDEAARQLVDYIMIIYGARNVFWGLATYAAAFFGSRRALGAIMVAGSALAGVDGWVCKMAGGGEWDHWGYAPMLALIGVLCIR